MNKGVVFLILWLLITSSVFLFLWIIIYLVGKRKKEHELNIKIRNVMERADLSYEDLYVQPNEKRVLLLKEYISQITLDKRRKHEKGN